MPTFNEYVDERGYYIRARPYNSGNITYQIKPTAEVILEKLGYEDGDEINWQTIQALKVPNLIHTGKQGTTDDDVDFTAVRESVDDLTTEQARTLLKELRSQATLSNSQSQEIEEILDVQSELQLSRLEENITGALEHAGKAGELSSIAVTDYEFEVDVSDQRDESENGLCNISITGSLGEPFNEPYQHGIFVCQEHGVEHWRFRGNFDQSWGFKSEMYRQMGVLLPIIIEELEQLGIDPGSPKETPYPEIDRWGFD